MDYRHKDIEQRWQQYWKENNTYKTEIDNDKPKFYVLDMFPYPSGAGLHVGHPLGYIASDIYARYKRLRGFNVLHPMGYDAYGLPAEQYAIQTGQHPEVTTRENIARYRSQLDRIGFCYDWNREIRTCDPGYYKWTQWAFIEMFNHYYDTALDKAMPVAGLEAHFAEHGSEGIHAAESKALRFTAGEWNAMDAKQKSDVLMNYRIAYQGETMVNWCPELGTVLANDEVSEGLSVRGGFPVEQKLMNQWCLRVSAYAPRLLDDLETVEWSDSLKETQRNWIGRSEGAEMRFPVAGKDIELEIFTTRADTIFGVTFMVLAPESAYVKTLTTPEQKEAVEAYLNEVKHKTERERQIEKKVSGVFTGSYAINPLTGKEIPVWISDYVLAGYGTGAIMAVPAHDSRDYAFARHFSLPIIPLIEGADVSEQSFDAKEGKMINSCGPKLDLNGLDVKEAIAKTKDARMYILNEIMLPCISQPRPTVGQYAPKIIQTQINPEKIGDVVGQRGKTINAIIEQTGVRIDITDDGFVSICGTDQKMMDKACEMIKIITTDFEEGQVFKGKVVSIKEFGAFIEFAPGKEGMVHISKISKERINHIEDVLTLGDMVTVVCLGKDKMGRISFSMKDVAQK